MYPEKLKERREAITEDERELLNSFGQARVIGARPRMQNGNRAIGVNIPLQLNRTTFFWLVVVFVVAMIFTVSGRGINRNCGFFHVGVYTCIYELVYIVHVHK